MSRYGIRPDASYVVNDYNRAKPFSSFLPGIAGVWGIPLWVYYVNRGQAVACFGTQDKDHAIMQFESAKLHEHRVATEGFRTFLRVKRGGRTLFYEPFRTANRPYSVRNSLTVRVEGLRLEEVNRTLELATTVEFFTVPNEGFAALARKVTIRNTGTRPVEIELLDGAARLVPYGEAQMFLQVMPFITEGYLRVRNLADRVPFINMMAQPSDNTEPQHLESGNFFVGFAGRKRLPAIVDPERVFGDYTDLMSPYPFAESRRFNATAPQMQHCQTCCGFVHHRVNLPGGGEASIRSFYGTAPSLTALPGIAERVAPPPYFDAKRLESISEIESIKRHLFVHTAHKALNLYVPQTFLDNTIRGGLPLTLPSGDRRHVLHVFSRKHGDLERDYNFFRLAATRFSQGNGDFRDVNQNRRSDVWINPDVGDGNVRWFFTMLQPDGFNPLTVKGAMFRVMDTGKLPASLPSELISFLTHPFSPGSLFAFLDEHEIDPRMDRAALLEAVLSVSEKIEEAEFERGYWTDHWLYNFDLLAGFLQIFPERRDDLLWGRRDFTYWDPDTRVLPRDEKYVLYAPGKVWHIDSIAHDPEKAAMIAQRRHDRRCVRTRHGRGEVYHVTLLQKILCLLVNKMATLAPSGMGMDMDGGRPGWHDSINALPGPFGATTSELFHLLRAIRFLRQQKLPSQALPIELHEFATRVIAELRAYRRGGDYRYWDRTNSAKEKYREAVRFGFDGAERNWTPDRIERFLDLSERRLLGVLARAVDPATGLPVTYITHDAVEYTLIPGKKHPRGFPCVRVTNFAPHFLPVFLEAPTHAMKIEQNRTRAKSLFGAVRCSPLYDRPLKMYIVGESVRNEPHDVGRIWAWPPGWFENENVFLHLEHKYMLAALHAGLYDEFFEDFRRCLIPFQPLDRYGRNPLENASFICSSRHPRPSCRGRGFLPRSSGTTSEVIEMILRMSFGPQPFTFEKGKLNLRLAPILPSWLFTKKAEGRFPKNSYTATFLGQILVTYLNPGRRDTYGPNAARVAAYTLKKANGERITVEGPALPPDLSLQVRERKVEAIVVELR